MKHVTKSLHATGFVTAVIMLVFCARRSGLSWGSRSNPWILVSSKGKSPNSPSRNAIRCLVSKVWCCLIRGIRYLLPACCDSSGPVPWIGWCLALPRVLATGPPLQSRPSGSDAGPRCWEGLREGEEGTAPFWMLLACLCGCWLVRRGQTLMTEIWP